MDAIPTNSSGRAVHFADRRRRLLIIYDHHVLHVKAIEIHLESFYRFSEFAVAYISSFARCDLDLSYFDAVLVHYSVKVCFPGHLTASFAKALRRYHGVKALMLHDEYEATDAACRAIEELGIGLVFTCVPPDAIPQVYPPGRFAHVEFVNVLTGYVPPDLGFTAPIQPFRERPILIGYRGRDGGYWYGDLYREKVTIGQRMQAVCAARGLTTDIAWREEDRIYGEAWYRFLGRCKATLGTESGANVFDRDGSIVLAVQRELLRNPAATYEEIHAKYLKAVDGQIVMNQVPPKIFEAIACRTALVLFEGRYSGVIAPEKHFIALEKDFSNVDEVLQRLSDDAGLEAMTERAFDDVIRSGRYSYQSFVRSCDDVLERHMHRAPRRPAEPWLPLPPCDALPRFRNRYRRHFAEPHLRRLWRWLPHPLRALFQREHLRRLWIFTPAPLRTLFTPLLRQARRLLTRTP